MIVTPFQKPERYVACPACGKGEHQVSHLAVGTRTAWYCHEEGCRRRFSLTVVSGGYVVLEVMNERCVATLVTLRSSKPVTIVVEGMRFVKDGDVQDEMEEARQDRYFYEEHTCPTNYLRVLEVRDDSGDKDPHGIFEYIGTVLRPASEEVGAGEGTTARGSVSRSPGESAGERNP